MNDFCKTIINGLKMKLFIKLIESFLIFGSLFSLELISKFKFDSKKVDIDHLTTNLLS
jgi:hypothetical protein